MDNEYYEYERVTVKYNFEIHQHKNILQEYGLRQDNKTRNFFNKKELDSKDIDRIKAYCHQYKLVFFTEIIIEEELYKAIEAKYKLQTVGINSYLITLRKNDNPCYFISSWNYDGHVEFDILDTRYHKHMTLKHKITYLDNLSELLKALEEQKIELTRDYKLNIEKISNILYVFLNDYNRELNYEEKLNNFKYFVKNKITKEFKDGFLCNAVPGFFPETKFYIKNNKLVSNLNGFNPIRYEQEKKIWKYLMDNKKYVGKIKSLTLREAFYNSKIFTNDETGIPKRVIINNIKELSGGQLTVQVFDGIKNYNLPNLYTRDSLFRKVIQDR